MLPNTAPISCLRLTLRMRNSNTTTPAPDHGADRGGHRSVQIERMQEKSRASQHGHKKGADDKQVDHERRLPDRAASLLGAAPTGCSVGDQYITEIESRKPDTRPSARRAVAAVCAAVARPGLESLGEFFGESALRTFRDALPPRAAAGAHRFAARGAEDGRPWRPALACRPTEARRPAQSSRRSNVHPDPSLDQFDPSAWGAVRDWRAASDPPREPGRSAE